MRDLSNWRMCRCVVLCFLSEVWLFIWRWRHSDVATFFMRDDTFPNCSDGLAQSVGTKIE